MLNHPARMFAYKVTSGLSDQSDDHTVVPRISLDAFYDSVSGFKITDEKALEYMTYSSKQAMVSFRDQEEMMSFKNDFQAALAFIQKLDEVDVKGQEPLGNVLEFYGGNDSKMRSSEDFLKENEDQTKDLNFKEELSKLNSHMRGNFVVLNRTKQPNLEME